MPSAKIVEAIMLQGTAFAVAEEEIGSLVHVHESTGWI